MIHVISLLVLKGLTGFSLRSVGKSNFYRDLPDLTIFDILQEVLLVEYVRSLLKYHFVIKAFLDQLT